MEWDSALAAGPEAFGRQVAAGDRGGFRRRGAGGNGHTNGSPGGYRQEAAPARAPVAVGPGLPAAVATAPARVSPLRADAGPADAGAASFPPIAPAEPIPTYGEPVEQPSFVSDESDEPALPDEARARAAEAAGAPTRPVDAGPGQVLHVRFTGPAERLVGAMEAFKGLMRDRPGATQVVLHVPATGGGTLLPLPLRNGVAYDAELLAEVSRRLGEGTVEVRLD
jgi:hypothetical protein